MRNVFILVFSLFLNELNSQSSDFFVRIMTEKFEKVNSKLESFNIQKINFDEVGYKLNIQIDTTSAHIIYSIHYSDLSLFEDKTKTPFYTKIYIINKLNFKIDTCIFVKKKIEKSYLIKDKLILTSWNKTFCYSLNDYSILWEQPIPLIENFIIQQTNIGIGCNKKIVDSDEENYKKDVVFYGIDLISGKIIWSKKSNETNLENKKYEEQQSFYKDSFFIYTDYILKGLNVFTGTTWKLEDNYYINIKEQNKEFVAISSSIIGGLIGFIATSIVINSFDFNELKNIRHCSDFLIKENYFLIANKSYIQKINFNGKLLAQNIYSEDKYAYESKLWITDSFIYILNTGQTTKDSKTYTLERNIFVEKYDLDFNFIYTQTLDNKTFVNLIKMEDDFKIVQNNVLTNFDYNLKIKQKIEIDKLVTENWKSIKNNEFYYSAAHELDQYYPLSCNPEESMFMQNSRKISLFNENNKLKLEMEERDLFNHLYSNNKISIISKFYKNLIFLNKQGLRIATLEKNIDHIYIGGNQIYVLSNSNLYIFNKIDLQ